MAITLGKDCTIILDGRRVGSARNVVLSESARTIDVNAFGSRIAAVYSTGVDCSVQIELNDPVDVGTLAFLYMHTGKDFQVSGGTGGFVFDAVLTGITESDPIDGVVTYQLEAKATLKGLR